MAATLSASIDMKVSPATLWDSLKNPHIIPKVIPDYVASFEYLEGDGGVGSVRLMKFGPAVAQHVTFSKEKIDVMDEATKTISYSVLDGEILKQFESYVVTVEVVQGATEKESVVNWTLNYKPVSSEVPPPEVSKQGAIATFKAIEAYLLQVPVTN